MAKKANGAPPVHTLILCVARGAPLPFAQVAGSPTCVNRQKSPSFQSLPSVSWWSSSTDSRRHRCFVCGFFFAWPNLSRREEEVRETPFWCWTRTLAAIFPAKKQRQSTNECFLSITTLLPVCVLFYSLRRWLVAKLLNWNKNQVSCMLCGRSWLSAIGFHGGGKRRKQLRSVRK